ncbi:hypothetical protein SAMN04515647_3711 [Cohaesibacter sp. ES.047]|uniref:hypothetical protein n=1 Tax=Cohaesibacter sp. ES.047 TaxID=1798205 RepID=UPI000BB709BC|nr:hypothetical protein [Cohaesibacter sp. ES.047]SNY93416.1 hypothetical protein SAMN04515647_3711 [Cohaesibacter sp. ES.047]
MTLASFTNHGSSTVEILHGLNVKTAVFTVLAGTYERGDVLEWDAANGRYIPIATAANADAVIMEGMTIAADQKVPVIVEVDDLNEDLINIGELDLTVVKRAFRAVGIYCRSYTPA